MALFTRRSVSERGLTALRGPTHGRLQKTQEAAKVASEFEDFTVVTTWGKRSSDWADGEISTWVEVPHSTAGLTPYT